MSKVRDDLKVISEVISESIFIPSMDMVKAKAAYWAVKDNGHYSDVLEQVGVTEAVRITGDGRVTGWWKKEGFYDWFTNKSGLKQKLAYLAEKVTARLDQILDDPDTTPNNIIAAGKLIYDINGMMPKSQNTKVIYADLQIQDMDARQLDELISKKSQPQLIKAKE